MEGNSPLVSKVYSLSQTDGPATPYESRYPSGSLIHDGVWYYCYWDTLTKKPLFLEMSFSQWKNLKDKNSVLADPDFVDA